MSKTPMNECVLTGLLKQLFICATIQLNSCEYMCLARASRENNAWLNGNGVLTVSFTVLMRLLHSHALMWLSSILSSSHTILIEASFKATLLDSLARSFTILTLPKCMMADMSANMICCWDLLISKSLYASSVSLNTLLSLTYFIYQFKLDNVTK